MKFLSNVHFSVDTVDKMKTGLGTIIREAGESKRLLCVTENIPSYGGQAHLYCICYTLNNVSSCKFIIIISYNT